MENVTFPQREQGRRQVLNSLLAEHMTLDQAAVLMGVSPRHARHILAANRARSLALLKATTGAANRPTQHPRPWRRCGSSGSYRYAGTNHSHLSELLSEREGIGIGRTHPATHPGQRRAEQSAATASAKAPRTPSADASASRRASPRRTQTHSIGPGLLLWVKVEP